MATLSSVLAWRIPGTGEPSGLLSMGSQRVGHDWSYLAAAAHIWDLKSQTQRNIEEWSIVEWWLAGAGGERNETLSKGTNSSYKTSKFGHLMYNMMIIANNTIIYTCVLLGEYILNVLITKRNGWNSLVVKWLGICLPMQRTRVGSLGPHAAGKPNLCTTTAEPALWTLWVLSPQHSCWGLRAPGPVLRDTRRHHGETPRHHHQKVAPVQQGRLVLSINK